MGKTQCGASATYAGEVPPRVLPKFGEHALPRLLQKMQIVEGAREGPAAKPRVNAALLPPRPATHLGLANVLGEHGLKLLGALAALQVLVGVAALALVLTAKTRHLCVPLARGVRGGWWGVGVRDKCGHGNQTRNARQAASPRTPSQSRCRCQSDPDFLDRAYGGDET